MRKLRLKLDALRVESFETAAAAPREAGTVHGHARPTRQQQTCDLTCEGDGCPLSGYGSCQPDTCEECTASPTVCPTGVPICCIA
ncbi:MAG TPA: pinensin family lanthipeptide [Longimicrobium sp.]|jgi:hypothetical protein